MAEHRVRYELIERIGVGGMAEVFKARVLGAAGFAKTVAVKRKGGAGSPGRPRPDRGPRHPPPDAGVRHA